MRKGGKMPRLHFFVFKHHYGVLLGVMFSAPEWELHIALGRWTVMIAKGG